MLSENQSIFTKQIEIFSYNNKKDEKVGLIGLHVLDNLLFHLEECTTPKQSWDKLV